MNEGEIQGQFFVFLKNIYLFILVVLGLSCGTWDLHCSMRDLLVAACRLLAVACGLLVVACMWDLVSRPGVEPGPLHWERRVLPTGPPGKSLDFKCSKGMAGILNVFADNLHRAELPS